MRQGIQTNFPHDQLREYGCYFFDLLQWASTVRGDDWNNDDIITLYDKFVSLGYMETDCFIVDPVGVLMNLTGKCFSVVRRTNVKPVIEPYIIYQKKPGHGHFTLFANGEVWDSLDPERPGVSDYKIDSYRVIA